MHVQKHLLPARISLTKNILLTESEASKPDWHESAPPPGGGRIFGMKATVQREPWAMCYLERKARWEHRAGASHADQGPEPAGLCAPSLSASWCPKGNKNKDKPERQFLSRSWWLTAWVPSSVPIMYAVARARVRSVQRLPA